jgi:hypothetical protein
MTYLVEGGGEHDQCPDHQDHQRVVKGLMDRRGQALLGEQPPAGQREAGDHGTHDERAEQPHERGGEPTRQLRFGQDRA